MPVPPDIMIEAIAAAKQEKEKVHLYPIERQVPRLLLKQNSHEAGFLAGVTWMYEYLKGKV